MSEEQGVHPDHPVPHNSLFVCGTCESLWAKDKSLSDAQASVAMLTEKLKQIANGPDTKDLMHLSEEAFYERIAEWCQDQAKEVLGVKFQTPKNCYCHAVKGECGACVTERGRLAALSQSSTAWLAREKAREWRLMERWHLAEAKAIADSFRLDIPGNRPDPYKTGRYDAHHAFAKECGDRAAALEAECGKEK